MKNNVCIKIVQSDLCIGCGACAGCCPTRNLAMHFNEFGAYIPVDQGRCVAGCRRCLDVCPFVDNTANEDTLAAELYSEVDGIHHSAETGYYMGCYAGHAAEGGFRANGSSGGMASWFLTELFSRNMVDRIACVVPNPEPGCLYKFTVINSADELKQSAKSAYYPVELSGVLAMIRSEEARYAIIGLPCFLKAVRLAMKSDATLRKRIVMTAGLVCGHLKTTAFAASIIRSLSLDENAVQSISFREKIPGKRSSDYGVSIKLEDGATQQGLMSALMPDAWGNGVFKPRACNFCDDIFAETADIAFMDAWLPAYINDWQGANIVLTRSAAADRIILEGMAEKRLAAQQIKVDEVIASQAGLIKHKREALSSRLWLADAKKERRPQKRVPAQRPRWFERQLVLSLEGLRIISHNAMREQRAEGTGIPIFQALMQPALRRRKFLRRCQIIFRFR